MTTTASTSSSSLSSRFKPYPRYKDSGVEWLGKIPEDWEVRRLKFAARPDKRGSLGIKGDIGMTERDDLYPAFSAAGQDIWVEQADYDEPGIVLSAIGARCGKCFKADGKWSALANTQVFLQTEQFDRDYVWYAVNVEDFWVKGGSAQPYVQIDASISQRIPMPLKPEQRAIAEFLDRETAKIDNLIAQKECLIELLEEKRAALITHAVTKGLDPDAPLRDSGIEWLGQIPKHWDVRRLKYAACIKTGFAFSSEDFVTDGIPLLRIGEITPTGQIDLSDAKFLPPEFVKSNADVLVQAGDIVMAMTGATIGKVGRYEYDTPALLNQRVCIFRPQSRTRSNYLWYLLNANFYIKHVLLIAFGGAQPNISDTELLACFIPLPHDREQQAIVDYLDGEMIHLAGMGAKVQEVIAKLKEYRSALITAAVTGKIDVRDEVKDAA
jgi:type I restriction enzyme, S subunit